MYIYNTHTYKIPTCYVFTYIHVFKFMLLHVM